MVVSVNVLRLFFNKSKLFLHIHIFFRAFAAKSRLEKCEDCAKSRLEKCEDCAKSRLEKCNNMT